MGRKRRTHNPLHESVRRLAGQAQILARNKKVGSRVRELLQQFVAETIHLLNARPLRLHASSRVSFRQLRDRAKAVERQTQTGTQLRKLLRGFGLKLNKLLAPPVTSATNEVSSSDLHNLPEIPPSSVWTRFDVVHAEGSKVMDHAVVYERVDRGADPADREYRVWCENLVEDIVWIGLEGLDEQPYIRIPLPATRFEGLPGRLDFERPKNPNISGLWRLFADSRVVVARFRLVGQARVDAQALRLEEAAFRVGVE